MSAMSELHSESQIEKEPCPCCDTTLRFEYSCYKYSILPYTYDGYKGWIYVIHCEQNYLGQNDDIEADDWCDSRGDAMNAAEDHIDRLENGEQ